MSDTFAARFAQALRAHDVSEVETLFRSRLTVHHFWPATRLVADRSSGTRLVFKTRYRPSAEEPWTNHQVTVYPCFTGLSIRVTGVERHRDTVREAFRRILETPYE